MPAPARHCPVVDEESMGGVVSELDIADFLHAIYDRLRDSVSLLKPGSKDARRSPSRLMFDQMITDYDRFLIERMTGGDCQIADGREAVIDPTQEDIGRIVIYSRRLAANFRIWHLLHPASTTSR